MVVNLQRGKLCRSAIVLEVAKGTRANYDTILAMILLFVICQGKNLHEPEAID